MDSWFGFLGIICIITMEAGFWSNSKKLKSNSNFGVDYENQTLGFY
jgi:hypothetical protein